MSITDQLEEERRIINAARNSSDEHRHYGAHARTALPLRNAQMRAVLALHKPDTVMTSYCEECSDFGTDDYPAGELIEYPCATVRAIEEATG